MRATQNSVPGQVLKASGGEKNACCGRCSARNKPALLQPCCRQVSSAGARRASTLQVNRVRSRESRKTRRSNSWYTAVVFFHCSSRSARPNRPCNVAHRSRQPGCVADPEGYTGMRRQTRVCETINRQNGKSRCQKVAKRAAVESKAWWRRRRHNSGELPRREGGREQGAQPR